MRQDITPILEAKTSRALAEIVAARLRIPGAFVSVCPCDTLGWTASVITRPGAVLFAQQLVDEITSELREQYCLQSD